MPNTLPFAWVKPVNKLFMQRGINSGLLSPVWLTHLQRTHDGVGISLLIHSFVQKFSRLLSTLNIVILPPLSSVYTRNPQSLLLQPLRKNLKGY